jgi:Kef-type K+ transport system membrane component KefB
MDIYLVAVQWIGLTLLASLVSVRLGISIALVEIMVGTVAGNIWSVLRRSGPNFWPAWDR